MNNCFQSCLQYKLASGDILKVQISCANDQPEHMSGVVHFCGLRYYRKFLGQNGQEVQAESLNSLLLVGS